jgi:hypothetical protein
MSFRRPPPRLGDRAERQARRTSAPGWRQVHHARPARTKKLEPLWPSPRRSTVARSDEIGIRLHSFAVSNPSTQRVERDLVGRRAERSARDGHRLNGNAIEITSSGRQITKLAPGEARRRRPVRGGRLDERHPVRQRRQQHPRPTPSLNSLVGLAVLPKHLVDAADRRASDGGVVSVMVVGVQPAVKGTSAR